MMRSSIRTVALVLSVMIFATIPVLAGSEVGDAAPELKAGGWINIESTTNWDTLAGKLILIEKWATW